MQVREIVVYVGATVARFAGAYLVVRGFKKQARTGKPMVGVKMIGGANKPLIWLFEKNVRSTNTLMSEQDFEAYMQKPAPQPTAPSYQPDASMVRVNAAEQNKLDTAKFIREKLENRRGLWAGMRKIPAAVPHIVRRSTLHKSPVMIKIAELMNVVNQPKVWP